MLNRDKKNITVAAGFMAVALALMVMRYSCTFSPPGSMVPGQGIIAETAGDVTIERAGKRQRPGQGDTLRPGDRLMTGPGSTALVEHARKSVRVMERSSVTWKTIDENREGTREKIDLTVHRGSVKVTEDGSKNNPDTVTVTDEKTGKRVTAGITRNGISPEAKPERQNNAAAGHNMPAYEGQRPSDKMRREPEKTEQEEKTAEKRSTPRENSIRPLLVPDGTRDSEPITVKKSTTSDTPKNSSPADSVTNRKAAEVTDYTKKPPVSLPPLR